MGITSASAPVHAGARSQEERLHTVSTGDVTFSIYPAAFHSLKFVVPPDHKDANSKGTFPLSVGARMEFRLSF